MLHQLPQSMIHDAVVSVGTVGHPITCAPPCEEIMRTGHCRMREACQKCHHCANQIFLESSKAGQKRLIKDRSKGFQPAPGVFQAAPGLDDPGPAALNPAAFLRNPLTPRGQLLGGRNGEFMRSSTPPPPSCASPTEAFMAAKGSSAGDPASSSLLTSEFDLMPSKGSAGHPDGCGPACKYARRKNGCRDGADCPNCHLCHWRRSLDRNDADQPPQVVISKGSRNHPTGCGPACKYVRRKGGCALGEDCMNCHWCFWRRGGADGGSGGSVAGVPEDGVCSISPQQLFNAAVELGAPVQVQQMSNDPVSFFTIRI